MGTGVDAVRPVGMFTLTIGACVPVQQAMPHFPGRAGAAGTWLADTAEGTASATFTAPASVPTEQSPAVMAWGQNPGVGIGPCRSTVPATLAQHPRPHGGLDLGDGRSRTGHIPKPLESRQQGARGRSAPVAGDRLRRSVGRWAGPPRASPA